MVETVYNVINLVASWFALVSYVTSNLSHTLTSLQGNFYLFFVSAMGNNQLSQTDV